MNTIELKKQNKYGFEIVEINLNTGEYYIERHRYFDGRLSHEEDILPEEDISEFIKDLRKNGFN